MMPALLVEDIAMTVPSGRLGIGEDVRVLTHMGAERGVGRVVAHVPGGIVVDTSGSKALFTDALFKFVVMEAEAPPQEEPEVGDSPGQALGLSQSPDAAQLPQDLQKTLVGVDELTDEQVDSVMRDVGDAAMKALRRIDVRDDEIYATLDRVQKAVKKALTSKG